MQSFSLSGMDIFDNTEYWKQNSEDDYCKTIQEIIECDPFGGYRFYIFSFVKRIDDVSGLKKMIHQPRLTKPDPVPGTTLLRVDPRDPGTATIVWTLPNENNFGLYKQGKMFSDPFVYECIQKFLKDPKSLMERMEGDLDDEKIRDIYKDILRQSRSKKHASKRKAA